MTIPITPLTQTTSKVHDETRGLSIGDTIFRTYRPLSVMLGPGVLGQIFDGIQRPLEVVFSDTESVFVPRLSAGPFDFLCYKFYFPCESMPKCLRNMIAMNLIKLWPFRPHLHDFSVGSVITGGDIFGSLMENEIFLHNIMLPPGAKTILKLALEF